MMPFGSGYVVLLGYDWFNMQPVGSVDGGWISVLNSALHLGLCDPPAPVPTMTEWGMIIFMVLAGFGALFFMTRKARTNN